MYQYHASLMDVHDGDTATFTVDLGFFVYTVHPVRLSGVNAPELYGRSRAAGEAARDWAMLWFQEHPGPYVLDTIKNHEFEKYGRLLGRVQAADGHVINDDILAAGQAVPYNP